MRKIHIMLKKNVTFNLIQRTKDFLQVANHFFLSILNTCIFKNVVNVNVALKEVTNILFVWTVSQACITYLIREHNTQLSKVFFDNFYLCSYRSELNFSSF